MTVRLQLLRIEDIQRCFWQKWSNVTFAEANNAIFWSQMICRFCLMVQDCSPPRTTRSWIQNTLWCCWCIFPELLRLQNMRESAEFGSTTPFYRIKALW